MYGPSDRPIRRPIHFCRRGHLLVQRNPKRFHACSSGRIPFAFLADIHGRFVKTYGRAALTALAYAMNDDFSRVLSQQMDYYSNDPNADSITRMRGEIDQVLDQFPGSSGSWRLQLKHHRKLNKEKSLIVWTVVFSSLAGPGHHARQH